MNSKHILMISEKETFLVRAMMQKTKAAGMDCSFVYWSIDKINAAWNDVALVCLYMDEDKRPGDDVLQFLVDKMTDDAVQMIAIGGYYETKHISDNVPGEIIYKIFQRPVNNDEFVETVKELFARVDSGEFKKSIMIVDDDPNYLSLVREWLKGTYKVSMANSGLQAIKMLGKNKVDLILLDNEMPVTSGPQVLEMLRSDDETKNIPVMFLTGKGDKESVMAVLALRPEGYFLKNIKKEELLENLKEYFILHK